MEKFLDRLVGATERYLTWRKNRQIRKREKQKKKNVVVDWLEAFVWAAFVVLIINQYVLQAYQIPSGSMMDTLLVNDRIFVNKVVFGPELLPGIAKVPGFVDPKRGEVIIFENPSYISRGPLFDIVQRVLYMMTLSMVDIDRDELGRPKAHFLIKRAVGMEYDRIRQRDGNLEIKPRGEAEWMRETDFQAMAGMRYPVKRMIPEAEYDAVRLAGIGVAHQDMRLPLRPEWIRAVKTVQSSEYIDGFTFDEWRTRTLYGMNPHDRRYGARWRIHHEGMFIPKGSILPLGDNRDNSRDGRYFGSVKTAKILGRAMFRYWPLPRIGRVR